jgi:dolichol-phosphate mannosyltransferase
LPGKTVYATTSFFYYLCGGQSHKEITANHNKELRSCRRGIRVCEISENGRESNVSDGCGYSCRSREISAADICGLYVYRGDNPLNLLICIPTYNEAENIEPFINAVFGNLPACADILVIDDNSPDGTADIVEVLIIKYKERLHILKRSKKQGLAAAYLAAFNWGLSRKYDVFLEIDADFSHNPKYIPEMIEEIQTCDVVIGSRNIPGGGTEGWSFMRNILSKSGSFYSRAVLGCSIKDLTGGFTMWKKSALLKIGLDKIISKGYVFQVEMKYRSWRMGCSVKEIPIVFTDRKLGKSKMSKRIFFEALLNVWKIKWNIGEYAAVSQFFKFAVTGGLGTITNLLLFFVCADKFDLPEIPVSIGCFLIAGTQNYIVNHKWSFADRMEKSSLSIRQWGLFLCASSLGLVANVTIMKFMVVRFYLPYKFIAQACGIAAGTGVNFFLSKAVVFKKKDLKHGKNRL